MQIGEQAGLRSMAFDGGGSWNRTDNLQMIRIVILFFVLSVQVAVCCFLLKNNLYALKHLK